MVTGIEMLRNMRILVVEDSPLVAMMLVDELEQADAFVVGPAASLGEAIKLIQQRQIDAAILDVELAETLIYPVADLLAGRRTPFIFTTGHDAAFLPERFADVPNCAKPAPASEVLAILTDLIERRGSTDVRK